MVSTAHSPSTVPAFGRQRKGNRVQGHPSKYGEFRATLSYNVTLSQKKIILRGCGCISAAERVEDQALIADEVCRPSYSVTETGGLLEYRHSRPVLATYQDPASKIKRAPQDGSAAKGM